MHSICKTLTFKYLVSVKSLNQASSDTKNKMDAAVSENVQTISKHKNPKTNRRAEISYKKHQHYFY